jgi:hypothetical protein
MSQTFSDAEGPPIGSLHEVRATFGDSDAMQKAVAQLETSGFDRADLSLPNSVVPGAIATPETSSKPVDTGEDAQQARILHASGAGAAVALAAGGLVIATGGAAAPAVAAAVVGGGAAGALVHAISAASDSNEQAERDSQAASGSLVLAVRAPSAAKRDEAEAILRAAGGTDVEVH